MPIGANIAAGVEAAVRLVPRSRSERHLAPAPIREADMAMLMRRDEPVRSKVTEPKALDKSGALVASKQG